MSESYIAVFTALTELALRFWRRSPARYVKVFAHFCSTFTRHIPTNSNVNSIARLFQTRSKALCEDGDIGIPLRPMEYARAVAEEFKCHVSLGKWPAAALEKNLVDDYAKIHHDKIDVQIREMLISKGRAALHEEWLYVPTDFEALYMTYLTKKMAQKNNLQAVSDSDAAWTALTYYATGAINTEGDQEQLAFALAALMIGNFVPANITDISPKALLEFRKKYPDERRNFMRAIKGAASQLANCHDDAKVVEETTRAIHADVEESTNEFKRSMESLKAESFVGFKTLTVPMSTPVLGKLLALDFTTSLILGAAGLAIGSIAGVSSFNQKGKWLSRDSDYSYLVHAEREFPKTADAINLPRRLHYDLNEFIND